MIVGIMQPYFLPYIGYWQLMKAVDVFVIYDEIKYTKKGWINRNRMLFNNKDSLFTISLKKDSDFKNVNEREVAADFNKLKLIEQIKLSYFKAPYYDDVMPLIEKILNFNDQNLFNFNENSLKLVDDYLNLQTNFVVYSNLSVDRNLKGEDKVLSICKVFSAKTYINSIGGKDLYSKNRFKDNNIELKFLKSNYISYLQYGHKFIPWLSILDVLMFNSIDVINAMLDDYSLV